MISLKVSSRWRILGWLVGAASSPRCGSLDAAGASRGRAGWRLAVAGEILDLEDTHVVAAASDAAAGAESDNLGDHDLGGGERSGDSEQDYQRPLGEAP